MYQRPPVPEAEHKQPNAALRPAAGAAPGSAAWLLRLQRTAGNRAVGALIAPRQPRALARCGRGRCRCGGTCHGEGLEDEEHDGHAGRTGRPRLQRSVPAAAPPCPGLPDAIGEWRTESWLCAMRTAAIGDNTYTLATKGQRGAKGDAHGRSVELVHQVLANWLCEHPDVAARVSAPIGDRYTAASADVVREFQGDAGVTADGIVGPATLAKLDSYVAGGKEDPGPLEVCGTREAGEEARSAQEPLELLMEPWPTPQTTERSLTLANFTVGDSSLNKGPADTVAKLEELLDPDRSQLDGTMTALDCWKPVAATVYGYSDCHEEPLLAERRAEGIRDRFPGLKIGVESPSQPLTDKQLTPEDRRANRSVHLRVELAPADCDVPGGCSAAQLEAIQQAATTAKSWLRVSAGKLEAFAERPGTRATAAALAAMRRHFAFSQDDDIERVRDHARRVSDLLTAVSRRLTDSSLAIDCHTTTDAACALLVAYARNENQLIFCPSFFTFNNDIKGPLDQAHDVIHEIAHTLVQDGLPIVDHAYRRERYYRYMTHQEALTNAESYAALARELATGTEVPVDAPEDGYEDCPPNWHEALDHALAIASKWKRDAQLMAHVILPELLAGNSASTVLAAWTRLQRQYLDWTNTPLDDADRIYGSAATEFEKRFTGREEASDSSKIECEPGAKRGRRAESEWFVYVPKWYSTVLHVGPKWMALEPTKERPESLLAGLYSYWNLVAAKGKRRRATHMTRGGRAKEAQHAEKLAALARELSSLHWR